MFMLIVIIYVWCALQHVQYRLNDFDKFEISNEKYRKKQLTHRINFFSNYALYEVNIQFEVVNL